MPVTCEWGSVLQSSEDAVGNNPTVRGLTGDPDLRGPTLASAPRLAASLCLNSLFSFTILFTFRQRGRGKEGEREGEKHHCVVASCVPPTGDLACNPGMCPDWESNQQPIGLQASTQSTEPHQPGQKCSTSGERDFPFVKIVQLRFVHFNLYKFYL